MRLAPFLLLFLALVSAQNTTAEPTPEPSASTAEPTTEPSASTDEPTPATSEPTVFTTDNECLNQIHALIFNGSLAVTQNVSLLSLAGFADAQSYSEAYVTELELSAAGLAGIIELTQGVPLKLLGDIKHCLDLPDAHMCSSLALSHVIPPTLTQAGICVPTACTPDSIRDSDDWNEPLYSMMKTLTGFVTFYCNDNIAGGVRERCVDLVHTIDYLSSLLEYGAVLRLPPLGLNDTDIDFNGTDIIINGTDYPIPETHFHINSSFFNRTLAASCIDSLYFTPTNPCVAHLNMFFLPGNQVLNIGEYMLSNLQSISSKVNTINLIAAQAYAIPFGNHGACMAAGSDYHECSVSGFVRFCLPTQCVAETVTAPTFKTELTQLALYVQNLLDACNALEASNHWGFNPDQPTFDTCQNLPHIYDYYSSLLISTAIIPPGSPMSCTNDHTYEEVKKPKDWAVFTIFLFTMVTLMVLVSSLMWFFSKTHNPPPETLEEYSLLKDEGQQDETVTRVVETPVVDMTVPVEDYIIEPWCLQNNLYEIFYPGRQLEFSCFDGIRVFSMMWVVMCHLYSSDYTVYDNVAAVVPPGYTSHWSAQVVQNGFFSVDSFFFLSGFLGMYICIKKMGPKEPLPWTDWTPWSGKQLVFIDRAAFISLFSKDLVKVPFIYFNRLLRLAIPIFFVQLWHMYLVPLYLHGIEHADDYINEGCTGKWFWYNLLFVVNYIDNGKQEMTGLCLGQCWYLQTDMTVFLFIPIASLMWHFWHKQGTFFLTLMAWFGNILANAVWMGKYGCDGNPQLDDAGQPIFHDHCQGASPFIFDPGWNFYNNHTYFNTWSRYGAMVTGILLGMMWHLWLKPIKKFPWYVALFLFATMCVCLGGSCYGIYDGSQGSHTWQTGGNYYSFAERLWYAALYHQAWTVGLALLSALCFKNQLPVINYFLSHPIMRPIARLSFLMYLVHLDIIGSGLVGGNYTQHVTFNNWWFTNEFLGALIITIVFALFFALTVEKPFGKYTKYFLKWLQNTLAPNPKKHQFAASAAGSVQTGSARRSARSFRSSQRSDSKRKSRPSAKDFYGGMETDSEEEAEDGEVMTGPIYTGNAQLVNTNVATTQGV